MQEPQEHRQALPSGRFEGREAFMQGLRRALAEAAQQGWREMIFSDADFADWPLGESAVIDALNAWVRQGHQLTLLACHYNEVLRRHPRFVRWRITWDHKITARRSAGADPGDMPSSLWTPTWALQRLDIVRCVGVCGPEPERRVLLQEALNEWLLRRSTAGFPASVLGL